MVGGFGEGENRGDAGVGACEHPLPVLAWLSAERLGEPGPQLWPAILFELPGQVGGVQPQPRQQLCVELRFDRADSHVAAVGALVGVVEGRPSVEQVVATFVGPGALTAHRPHHLRQDAGTVDHRGVDHLALPRALPLPQGRQHAHEQEHGPAAEVSDEVQRRYRPLTPPADGVQRTRQADVVDVVSRALGKGAVLAQPVMRP